MSRYWKYNAVTRTGHEVTGTILGEKETVIKDLSLRGVHVIGMNIDHAGVMYRFRPRRKLTAADLSQFFEDFYNMRATGMGIPQVLQALKETTNGRNIMDILSALEEKIRDGDGLTEAIVRTGAFPWIVAVTLQAGEQTGKLQEAFQVLSRYFRYSSDMRAKLAGALVYPSIVFIVLTAVMLFVGLYVIPRLQGLLPVDATSHGAAQWALAVSAMMRDHWMSMLMVPIAPVILVGIFYKNKGTQFARWAYQCPAIGSMIKEFDLAYYFLNLSVLLKSGVPLLKAIDDLSAISPSQVSKHFSQCRHYMFGGMPFWEAVKMDKFFPLVVVFTLHRGEEMARLGEYCLNLSEYFNKRVAAKIDGLMHFIQPALLAFGGLFLVMIAFAFLVPIYGSLTKIAGG